VLFLAVPGAVYGWALASTGRSGFARVIVWRDPDVRDYTRFLSRRMTASTHPLILDARPVPVSLLLDPLTG